MPTPLQILLDPVSLTVLGIYALLMLWEAIAPARILPTVKGWHGRGSVAFITFFFLSSYLPLLWGEYLAQYRLFDLTGLGILGGTVAGILVYELGVYFWHRAMHRFDGLWRVFHQMHHSAERLDTFGAFYFSPFDMVGWTLLSSLSLIVIVGISAEATSVFLYTTTSFAIFQHANIRTPRWLGYFIQRPESHSLHHGKGVHGYNYSDLPIFDILFGTFRNPAHFVSETGFYNGASRRLVDMLLFRDVSHSPAAAGKSATSGAGRHFHATA